jgi:hypothetical protein
MKIILPLLLAVLFVGCDREGRSPSPEHVERESRRDDLPVVTEDLAGREFSVAHGRKVVVALVEYPGQRWELTTEHACLLKDDELLKAYDDEAYQTRVFRFEAREGKGAVVFTLKRGDQIVKKVAFHFVVHR